jgi:hypothetical protein
MREAGGRGIAAGKGFMSEGSMRRHDWIFDVLSDLQDYAQANGLTDLASCVEATLAVARREAEAANALSGHRQVRNGPTH